MVKDLKIVLDSTNYFLGSTVQGKLLVSVDKPKKYHSISVKFWGEAKVQWQENSNTYRNSKVYANNQVTVWKLENSFAGELPAGQRYFPFSFQLPHDTPPSSEHSCGHVRYTIEAKIFQRGVLNSMTKSNHIARSVLNVMDPSDVLSRYREPVTLERSQSLNFICFKFGCVSAKVSVPRTGFFPGEVVPATINLNNQSSRRIRVITTMIKIERFTSRQGRKKVLTDTIARTDSSSINPRLNFSYEDRSLIFPPYTPASLSSCSFISVEYFLVIRVIIPWSFNLLLKMPLVVARDHSATPVSSGTQLQTMSYSPQAQPQQAVIYPPPQPLHDPTASLVASAQENQSDLYLPSYEEAVSASS